MIVDHVRIHVCEYNHYIFCEDCYVFFLHDKSDVFKAKCAVITTEKGENLLLSTYKQLEFCT